MKSFALVALTASVAAAAPTEVIEERANQCYTPAFALGAGVAATTFWYNAAGTCPASANKDNINNAQCGLAATAGTVFTLLTGFSLQGIARYGASKRDEAQLPTNDTSLMEGHAVTYTLLNDTMYHPYPTDDGWTHYHFHAEDLSGSENHVTNVHSVHESGKNRITHALDTDANGLAKRDGGYTAYLAWQSGQTATFDRLPVCKTRDDAENAAIGIWNYGYSNQAGSFCADLQANGQTLDQGEFAIVTGTFNDEAGNC